MVQPMSRTFIAARVKDNPDLASSAQYLATLDSLPEPQRSRFRDGDFTAATEDDPFQVIPTAWVEAAMARWRPPSVMPPMDSMGVDVAMRGRDRTVIARRHGTWLDVPIVYEGSQCIDGPTVAGFCAAAVRDRAVIHIDVFGVGAEPYGHLMKMQVPALGVNVGDPAYAIDSSGKMRFQNLRTQLWWQMREALDPSNPIKWALPNDRRLLADLVLPKYERRPGGIIKVQSRDEIVKEAGRSPDFGSAYVLALMSNEIVRDVMGRRTAAVPVTDYDPFAEADTWRTWAK